MSIMKKHKDERWLGNIIIFKKKFNIDIIENATVSVTATNTLICTAFTEIKIKSYKYIAKVTKLA